jgi:hypothetical protein
MCRLSPISGSACLEQEHRLSAQLAFTEPQSFFLRERRGEKQTLKLEAWTKVTEFRPASTIYRKVGPKHDANGDLSLIGQWESRNVLNKTRTRTAPGNTLAPSGGPTSVIVEGGFSRYLFYLHPQHNKRQQARNNNKKKILMHGIVQSNWFFFQYSTCYWHMSFSLFKKPFI